MNYKTQQLTLVALFLALCILVPIIFHFIGAGPVLLPMFLPILLAGFMINFPNAILVGLLGPWISALTTGMPAIFPTALIMSVEGATATAVISYLFHQKNWHPWICLIFGVFIERVSLVLMGFFIAPIFNLPGELFSIYKLAESLPGVFLQLFLIPIILKLLWDTKIVRQNF